MKTSETAESVKRILRRLQESPRYGFPTRLVSQVAYRQGVSQIGLSAAGVAFWFIIAAFPGLIASVSLLGLFIEPSRVDQIIDELNDIAPGSLGVTILQQVETAASSEPSSLSLSFAISFTISAWSASAGLYNLSRGVRLAYGLPHRPYVIARLRALGGSFTIITALAIVTIGMAAVSAWASAQSGPLAALSYLITIPLGAALLIGIMVGLFALAVSGDRTKTPLLPGAVLAALGVIALYLGLGIALRFMTRYEAIYGALAGTVTVMLVLYAASYIILIGALVNGQWLEARSDQSDSRRSSPA